jgi:small subunit ribosomal protein S20|tara:strand:- start:5763 stop:5951 length:189 start_codon:yes stop_codon:yes gene_type:complete
MSKLRTLINNLLQTNDPVEADLVYKNTVSFIDKMVSKRLIHKNTAARRKTQITRHVNSIRKD